MEIIGENMNWQNPQDVIEAIHSAEIESNDILEHELSAKGVEAFPESPELWGIYGRHLWQDMKEDESETAFKKAFELDPDCAVALAARSTVYAGEGMLDDALKAAERAIELDPSNRLVLALSEDAFYVKGDSERTIQLTKKMCEFYPDDPLSYSHLSSAYFASGKKAEGMTVLEEAESRFHDCVPLMRKRALHMMRAELPAAIRLFKVCTDKSPGCSISWSQLSIALVAAQQFDEAREAALKALEINPRAVNAMESLARIALRTGNNQEAKEWQEKIPKAVPGIAFSAMLVPASNAFRLCQWKKVMILTDPIIKAPSKIISNVAKGMRARALIQLKRVHEAEQILNDLEQNGWIDVKLYELRGQILKSRGDHAGALAQFREGFEKYPTDGDIAAHLISALNAKDNENERENVIAALMENPPDTPWGLHHVAQALLQLGYKQQAHKLRWICTERFPNATEYHFLSHWEWLSYIGGLLRILLKLIWIRFTQK